MSCFRDWDRIVQTDTILNLEETLSNENKRPELGVEKTWKTLPLFSKKNTMIPLETESGDRIEK